MTETCDRCGASTNAAILLILPSGRVLAFCNHHYQKHAAELEAAGAVIDSQKELTSA